MDREAAPRRHEARHLVQQSLGKWCVGLVSRIRGQFCCWFVCLFVKKGRAQGEERLVWSPKLVKASCRI